VWRLASGGKSQDRLSKDSWFVAMKLVALVQSTGKCKMQYLYEVNPTSTLPLPDFHLEGPPDNVVPSDIDAAVLSLQEKQFKVAVSSPIVVGSSYTRFTQYVVSTTAFCPSFPVKTCQVRRRFSDFEWLHQRLTERFRGTSHTHNEVCNHDKLSKAFEVQIILTANNEVQST
ncbi:hypothetical protein DYB31_014193, partial [Aphanomyces astaci]